MHKSSLLSSPPVPPATITVTVRDKFCAAGLDPCDVVRLRRRPHRNNEASDRRLRRVHRDELVLECEKGDVMGDGSAAGRDSQSMAFFSTPGREALYSGDTSNNPSAAASRSLQRLHHFRESGRLQVAVIQRELAIGRYFDGAIRGSRRAGRPQKSAVVRGFPKRLPPRPMIRDMPLYLRRTTRLVQRRSARKAGKENRPFPHCY